MTPFSLIVNIVYSLANKRLTNQDVEDNRIPNVIIPKLILLLKICSIIIVAKNTIAILRLISANASDLKNIFLNIRKV